MTIDSNTGARPNPFARARHAFSAWLGRARDARALALNRHEISAEAAKWRWRA
jgi:hypothetical protein